MNLPFDLNLSGKTAVVTGAGGVLCSMFAKVLAQCGAKTAILDLNLEAAQKVADEITAEGYAAKAYKANVLDKEVMEEVHKAVLADFGPCDILINGAGGNNPRATTANEYYFPGDIDKDIANFFNLDKDGVSFVFNLNFLGTLIPTQVFAQDMLTREGCNILNISSPDQDPRLFRRKGRHFQLHPVAGRPLLQGGHPGQRHCSRLLCDQAEPGSPLQRGRNPYSPDRQDPCRHPHGAVRQAGRAGRCADVPSEQRRCQLCYRRSHPRRRRFFRLLRCLTFQNVQKRCGFSAPLFVC